MTSKYDVTVDLTQENTSHTQLVRLVGANKRVLDVGCATGYLARTLVATGCTVCGVEVDSAAAELARPALADLLVGDLEQLDLGTHFGTGRFDAVVFGDVLEHLRSPLAVLRQAGPLLAPGGFVVASIPNITHGAVRLALLQGRWQYRQLGLLDDTHLRFFTRSSVETLLRSAGLVPIEMRRTTAGLFETELGVHPDDFPPDLVERVLDDPEATTYQFIVRAIRDEDDGAAWARYERVEATRREQHALRRRVERQQAGDAAPPAANAAHLAGEDPRVAELEAALDRAREELAAVLATRTMRSTRWARAAYGRLRRRAR